MARFIIEVEEGETRCDSGCPLYSATCMRFGLNCQYYDLSTMEIIEEE